MLSTKWPFNVVVAVVLMSIRDIFGGPRLFLEFYVPLPTPFYCIFIKKFSKTFEIWSCMYGNIFEKFLKIAWNFLNFFKIEKKTIIIALKIVQRLKLWSKVFRGQRQIFGYWLMIFSFCHIGIWYGLKILYRSYINMQS